MSSNALIYGQVDTAAQVYGQPSGSMLRSHSNRSIVETFLKTKGSSSANTQRAYSADLSQFLEFIGELPLQQLTLETLLDYQAHIKEAYPHKSPDRLTATAKRKLSAVKSLLSFAQKTGAVPFNVGAALELKRGKSEITKRILSEEQVFKLIGAANSDRNEALIRFLYATGARVGEVSPLVWGDVVEQPDGKGIVSLYGEKTDETRSVAISSNLLDRLKALVPDGCDLSPELALFSSQKGGQLSARRMREVVQATAKRAKVDLPVTPHWFRHSHATHARNRGADLAVISKTLGHSSIDTTLRMYTHLAEGESSSNYLAV